MSKVICDGYGDDCVVECRHSIPHYEDINCRNKCNGDTCYPVSKPKRWKPKLGERIWMVNISMATHMPHIHSTHWADWKYFSVNYERGNCYRTRQEAREARKRVIGAYKGE